MWFEQTRKSSEEGLFPGGKGSEEVTKQPPRAIAGTAPLSVFLTYSFSSNVSCKLQHNQGDVETAFTLCGALVSHSDTALSLTKMLLLFNFPSAAQCRQTPSHLPVCETPLADLLSLSRWFWPWLRELCHISAPAALSVHPIKGFVLTLIPVVNLPCCCSSLYWELCVGAVLCHESRYKEESEPFRPCFTSVTLQHWIPIADLHMSAPPGGICSFAMTWLCFCLQ